MNNNMKYVLFGFIFLVSLVFFGTGTYAWFKWVSSANDNVVINLTATSTITFVGGEDINGTLEPVYDYEEGISKSVKIIAELPGNYFNLYFKINKLPNELKQDFFLWALYKDDEYITGGNFSNYNVNDNISLLVNRSIPINDYDIYTLYLWFDGSKSINYDSVYNKSVSISLYATGEGNAIDEINES